MTTTLEKPGAAPKPGPGGLRFVAVRANLMPTEVLSKRQTEVVRKQVVLGLVVVVGLLVAWFGLSWFQTHSARSDLSSARNRAAALQSQQRSFAPLVNAQSQTQTIQGQLHTLMANDLSWQQMLTKLRGAAPSGLALTSVTGTVGAGANSTPTAATAGSVGQLTLTGTAHSKNDVATYSDKLSTVSGLAAPLITNVTTASGNVTFSMTVGITPAALGGRYTPAQTSKTGGK